MRLRRAFGCFCAQNLSAQGIQSRHMPEQWLRGNLRPLKSEKQFAASLFSS